MTPTLPDPAASAAVLIGASTFRRLSPLPGVANNIADLAETLADRSLWGLPAARTATLLDRADSGDLIGTLARLADQARDTFIVYYSGHGLVTREGDLVLATPESDTNLPQYTALPYAWVREVVRQCRAARRIVILDCCFSGRALGAMTDASTAVAGQMGVDGIYVLTSSPATSPSFAPPDARNTAFTGGLLDILRHGIPGGGELLSLDDVYDQTLLAMARHGWPRPQRLGTNTVGRLGILRNRAWRSVSSRLGARPARPSPRHRPLADGVRQAVAVVAPVLAFPEPDALAALNDAFPHLDDPAAGDPGAEALRAGIRLVRETMQVMRQQFGDGATMAAVVLGVLVDGLQTLLDAGWPAETLQTELRVQVTQLARQLAAHDGGVREGEPAVTAAVIQAIVRTALGQHEVADAVMAAAASVGPGNVEVIPAQAYGQVSQPVPAVAASAFTLSTVMLSPNAAAGPVSLEAPLIVVSADGDIDVRALRDAADGDRLPLLIISPRVSIVALRGLLHSFTRTAVVRPEDGGFDLIALRDRLGTASGRAGWARARRALILPGSTTIDRPTTDLRLPRNRITLALADPQVPASMDVATRALAIARSAADAGPVPGAGRALFEAASALRASSDVSPVAALVGTAAAEPHRLLRLAAGRDQAGQPGQPDAAGPETIDALATVRGALAHAAATAGRYLSEA